MPLVHVSLLLLLTVEPVGDLQTLDPPEDAVMGDGLGDLQLDPPTQNATCAAGTTLNGIDVSKWNGTVDWNKVAAAGTKFAFVRVSDGINTPDPKFAENWQNARAAGVTTGVYQFFRPNQDPVAQANLLLDKMGPLQPGDLPPVIDVEATGGKTKAQVTAAIHQWVDRVEGQLGVKPIIYSGRFFWQDNVGSSDFSNYPFWIAHYTNGCPNLPVQWSDWEFHQYTESGSVNGVSGNVDRNKFNGDAAALAAMTFGGPAACGDGFCAGAESADSCFLDCPPCSVIPPDGLAFDNGDGCYTLHGPAEYWRQSNTGHGGNLVWTETTQSTMYNYASIDLFFEQAGEYDVHVFLVPELATATNAKYKVTRSGQTQTITFDQTQNEGWTMLGTFSFAEGGGQSIRLEDLTGTKDKKLVFDAIRVVPKGTPVCDDDGRSHDGTADDLDLDAERGDEEAGGCSVDPSGRGGSLTFGLGALLLFGARRRRALRAVVAAASMLGLAACDGSDGGDTRDIDDLHEDDRDDPGACGEDAPNAGGDDGAAEPPPPPPAGTPQVCYPGADNQGTTCFPIVAGNPYTYPAPLNTNYRKPIAYLDVKAINLDTKIAPNFKLSEISQPHKGQFQVVQPHAIKKLQDLRNQVGALTVNSGFRSPPYNQQIGGATSSRHMYGDAFDVVASGASQQTVMNKCNALGAGYVAKYASGHVHCDWRNIPVDQNFYGALAQSKELPPVYAVEDLQARIVDLGAGVLGVEATGYDSDEGPLLNEWQAFDADGELLDESAELEFLPPTGTVTVRVMVGGLAEVEHDLVP